MATVDQERIFGIARLGIVTIALSLAEIQFFSLFYIHTRMHILLFFIAHLASVGLVSGCLYLLDQRQGQDSQKWSFFALGLGVTVPILGIGILVVFYFVLYDRSFLDTFRIQPFPAVEDEFSPEMETPFFPRHIEFKSSSFSPYNIEPLIDIFRGTDAALKKSAIMTIADSENPALMPLLFDALKDSNSQVYQLAHAKLAALQEKHTIKIYQTLEMIQENPHHCYAHIKLGQIYETYAMSGLLDDVMRNYYFDAALQANETALLHTAEEEMQKALRLKIAALYIQRGSYPQAQRLYWEMFKTEENADVYLGLLKICYEDKDYQKIFDLIRSMRASQQQLQKQAIGEQLQWWLAEV